MSAPPDFDAAFQHQLELLIRWRRDVRHFRTDPVSPSLIAQMLQLAGASPSVGFSQPARFVLVESAGARAAVRENFMACNQAALAEYGSAEAELYAQLKLAGLDEAPVHLAIFCDEATGTGRGLGRRTMPEMLRYSVVTMIQTLWLWLRAHGLGLGWVSILDPQRLATDLDVPECWALVAYCCIGYPEREQAQPELLLAGWEQRQQQDSFLLRR